jgi:hypothetical protein
MWDDELNYNACVTICYFVCHKMTMKVIIL